MICISNKGLFPQWIFLFPLPLSFDQSRVINIYSILGASKQIFFTLWLNILGLCAIYCMCVWLYVCVCMCVCLWCVCMSLWLFFDSFRTIISKKKSFSHPSDWCPFLFSLIWVPLSSPYGTITYLRQTNKRHEKLLKDNH